LVRRLLPHYEVLWVNTIGTRTPKFDRATFSRAASKMWQWSPGSRRIGPDPLPKNLRVVSPKMWPWFRRPVDRWLNRRLLRRSLSAAIASMSTPRCAISTIPVVSDLVGWIPVDRWIYYCVDDLAAWPGLDGETLLQMERSLVRKVHSCVAVSRHLRDHLERRSRESELLTHGVDLEFWRSERSNADLNISGDEAEGPWFVFWGLIDERLDSDWLLALAQHMTQGTILLVGPVQSVDAALRRHPRIRLVGPLSYDDLPTLAQQADVLVMPYRQMPATEAMQPLKLKEYLATGLPCVVSRLPATEEWSDCLDVVDSSESFVETVISRAETGVSGSQLNSRKRLEREDWNAKAEQFRSLIEKNFACINPSEPNLALTT
jgi:glycosyltransferase involved in cell wall biosynthesis